MFLLYMNPILIAAAVVPAVFLLIRVYRADRLEPEPSGLLLSLILRGVFATVIAMVLEELGSALLGSVYAENSLPYNIIMYFVIVAFPRRAQSISCSAAGHGAPTPSTASSTAWCTPCSSRSASPCGKISATSPCTA